jgi:diguanylate cyclase (GGDEF)-like protein
MVTAAGAVVSLWAGARKYRGSVARGYRWLSGTALFWLIGLVLSTVETSQLSGSTGSLSLADVAPLLALAMLAAGMMVLASGSTPSSMAGLADGYVMAVAFLVIGWVGAFGNEYHHSDERPEIFLLNLLHPLTDLALLGAMLPVLTVAWQRLLVPYLSLLVLTGADCVGVGARLSGGREGILEQVAVVVAACLLGASPWVEALAAHLAPKADGSALPWRRDGVPASDHRGGAADRRTGGPFGMRKAPVTSSGAATIIAALAAAVAAVVVIVNGLASAPASGLALVIAGGAAVLVMGARMLTLVRENGTAVKMWRESGNSLRDLAVRTGDIVLLCDLDGTIIDASQPAAGFSYTSEQLTGKALADFVHPEDLAAITSVIRRALTVATDADLGVADPGDADPDLPDQGDTEPGVTGQGVADPGDADARVDRAAGEDTGRFSCRLRAADGTWRHIECAVLRYQMPGEPALMLLTVRDVSDQVALRQQVNHLTFHDGLTGLPNRAYVEDRVRDALGAVESSAREGSSRAGSVREGAAGDETACADAAADEGEVPGTAGVIFLDLDGFTAVNDLVGHGAGDLVLAQAARRIRAVVPAHGTVARWGSDEFAVIMENVAGEQEVSELAERLVGAVAAEPFRAADREIGLTASVGVALADGNPADLLLRNADVAMARAKDSGGGRVEIYAAHMHDDVVRRLGLASDLQRALYRDELTLQYQPVVELATSRVTSAEALVRWHRGDELVKPREFLAVAEESGAIVALGEWVLGRACAQGAAWRAADWDVGVSVNLSRRQLNAHQAVSRVAAALAESGLPPAALTVEVNERVLVEDAGLVTRRLAELRELGVRLAIDDFGIGYASLAHLRQLPVDIIKIDPSFVAGLGNDPTVTMLTKTIVQVGRDLGIDVVAEGIEQPHQLAELREMGCGYGQGFLVARPMAAPGVEALIRTSTGNSRGNPRKPGVPAA